MSNEAKTIHVNKFAPTLKLVKELGYSVQEVEQAFEELDKKGYTPSLPRTS